jgi:SRSO17 transposase
MTAIGLLAWVVDDTGVVADGTHSPGVKRQYSRALGKIGNCQLIDNALSPRIGGGRERTTLG